MAKRVTLSGDHLGLSEIAAHHQDLESSLTLYFSTDSPRFLSRFIGYTGTEVTDELLARLDEADLTSSLTVLASVEAAFRIDYLQRCSRKAKDPLSRAFRNNYRAKQQQAKLEDEIFDAWVDNYSSTRTIIGELRSVFRFRHWLAHGRYWTPKLGRRYDFGGVFALADLTLRSFPFFGIGNWVKRTCRAA
jgi:hypothetical protein